MGKRLKSNKDLNRMEENGKGFISGKVIMYEKHSNKPVKNIKYYNFNSI